MGQLVPMVDVLIANEEDAADVFGICAEATDITAGKLNVEGYRSVARQLVERFGCKKIAVTLRESLSASDNNWSGMLYDGVSGEMVVSKKYAIRLVDRLGGGDSFGSGLILRAAERLWFAGSGGVCRGGFRAQADHRGRCQPRHGG